jgi:hypothetical protein
MIHEKNEFLGVAIHLKDPLV